jgi:hypothetical protein
MREEELLQHCQSLPYNENGCQIFDLFYGPKPRNKNNRKMTPVPRIVLEYKLGREIKPGHLACHHCDTPRCVNPDHIYEGTPQSNGHDRAMRNSPLGIPRPLISLANRGTNNHFSRMTEQQVLEIRKLREQGFRYEDLAIKFNVSWSCIRKICSNGTWRHLPHCTKKGRDYV